MDRDCRQVAVLHRDHLSIALLGRELETLAVELRRFRVSATHARRFRHQVGGEGQLVPVARLGVELLRLLRDLVDAVEILLAQRHPAEADESVGGGDLVAESIGLRQRFVEGRLRRGGVSLPERQVAQGDQRLRTRDRGSLVLGEGEEGLHPGATLGDVPAHGPIAGKQRYRPESFGVIVNLEPREHRVEAVVVLLQALEDGLRRRTAEGSLRLLEVREHRVCCGLVHEGLRAKRFVRDGRRGRRLCLRRRRVPAAGDREQRECSCETDGFDRCHRTDPSEGQPMRAEQEMSSTAP